MFLNFIFLDKDGGERSNPWVHLRQEKTATKISSLPPFAPDLGQGRFLFNA